MLSARLTRPDPMILVRLAAKPRSLNRRKRHPGVKFLRRTEEKRAELSLHLPAKSAEDAMSRHALSERLQIKGRYLAKSRGELMGRHNSRIHSMRNAETSGANRRLVPFRC